MSIRTAVLDLQGVLEQSRYIDRVDSLPFRSGSRKCTMTITQGGQTQTELYGKTRTKQMLELTLTVKIAVDPGTMADLTKEIDKEIIADRRRSGNAQTTILSEAGWEPVESEGKSIMAITRGVEIHVYDS
jgi:hypothetical protein